jgi:hypothetical protein
MGLFDFLWPFGGGNDNSSSSSSTSSGSTYNPANNKPIDFNALFGSINPEILGADYGGGGGFFRKDPINTAGITNEVMNSYVQAYPILLQEMMAAMPYYESMKAKTSKAVSQDYLDIQKQQKEQGAQQDLDVLNTTGSDLTQKVLDLNKQVDPEYFSNRELTASKVADLLNSYDLNGLSANENAAVERAVNRGNVLGGKTTPSASTTVENAMMFGDKFDQKRANLSGAINTANQFATVSKSGIDPFQVTFGRPQGQSAVTEFGNIGSTTSGMGNTLQDNLFGTANAYNELRTDQPSKYESIMAGIGEC